MPNSASDDSVEPVPTTASGRTPTSRLRAGLPAVVVVVAVGAVPFLLDGTHGDADSIRTAEVPSGSDTADSRSGSKIFTSRGAVLEDATDVGPTPPTTEPASLVPGSTTTVAPITVGTLPTEPEAAPDEPIAPPADPRGFEEEVLLGGISIPTLGVDEPLLEGIRLTTLDNGPGHWPGTALPGDVGNVVVAAHRTSHGGPFRNIDQLVAGDVVLFDTDDGEIEYRVTETEIVDPDAIWIVDPTDTATATLFACHPPGSVAQRIVVRLELA